MILTKIVSSMEKCFLDGSFAALSPLSRVSILKNERLSFQLACANTELRSERRCGLRVSGVPAAMVHVRRVESVPVAMPVYNGRHDDNYLRTAPGMYPDLLIPLSYCGTIMMGAGQMSAFWIDIEPNGELPAGDHTLTLSLTEEDTVVSENKLELHVIDACLPDHGMYVTQWFHCDCLAQYYRVEPLSERHWEIIENFARTAVKNGINLLLTPIFTPPLDTSIGGERMTIQLVGVTRTGSEYTFDFSLLDRWIDMCDRVGVRYLEISHLFTQWGAAHAPKVMATVDGEYRRLFGWETDATGCEYSIFLRTLLTAMLAHLRERGDDTRCVFHISDEPQTEHLEQYMASKAVIADLIKDYLTVDALSNFSFYQKGVVESPVPANSHIGPFLKANIKGLWTYYCGGHGFNNISNRLISMPGARTRCIGMQFFKYDIAGFLQWGYNFYNNRWSYDAIDPYRDTCGEFFVPGGDCFSVYPAPDGTAYESMRLLQFADALSDVAAMKLAASLCGKDAVVQAMERAVGEIRFDHCLRSAADMHAAREAVNSLIEKALG